MCSLGSHGCILLFGVSGSAVGGFRGVSLEFSWVCIWESQGVLLMISGVCIWVYQGVCISV